MTTTTTVARELDRARLIEDHVGIVRAIAWDLIRHGCPAEAEDLVGDGMVGLCGAAARFDPGRGVAFQSWAWPRVKGAMLDGMRRTDSLGRGARGLSTHRDTARHRFAAREHRFPTPEELARETDCTLDDLARLDRHLEAACPISLHEPIVLHGDEPRLIADTCGDPGRDTEREAFDLIDRDRLRHLLGRLKSRQQMVLGLLYWQDMTMREIGEILGVTESRVCQLHKQALERLRELLTADELADAA